MPIYHCKDWVKVTLNDGTSYEGSIVEMRDNGAVVRVTFYTRQNVLKTSQVFCEFYYLSPVFPVTPYF